MAELPEGTQVRRDESGVARSVRLPHMRGHRGGSFATTPSELGGGVPAAFRRFVPNRRGQFGLLTGQRRSYARQEQLRFKEEKNVAGSATIAYDQTLGGLPSGAQAL